MWFGDVDVSLLDAEAKSKPVDVGGAGTLIARCLSVAYQLLTTNLCRDPCSLMTARHCGDSPLNFQGPDVCATLPGPASQTEGSLSQSRNLHLRPK